MSSLDMAYLRYNLINKKYQWKYNNMPFVQAPKNA